MAAVRFMVMFDDESVDVSFTDGSRLQLSPCGSEYVLEKAPPAHPLHERRRVRHRTRFTISEYRALLVDALNFRNKYAARPYLPEELIPEDQKEKLGAEVSEVEWPSADSCSIVHSSAGDVTVCSVDGHARLVLSTCGQEFTVEFTCRSSRNEERPEEPQGLRSAPAPSTAARHLRSSETEDAARSARRITHTRVVQHHSGLHHPHTWRYPLSVALSQWGAQRAQCSDAIGQQRGAGTEGELGHGPTAVSQATVKCNVPPPLPLTCPCPHQHRWRYGSGASDWSELDASAELVKVVWCHGVVYRVIGGAVPVVEVSPGDGSVIRSNGVLAEYFTHYRPSSSTTVESVYYLNGLPPDLPGQTYSIRSAVTRASRILQCYKQASTSTTPIMPQCCWRRVEVKECAGVVSELQVAGTGQFQALSDGTAHITFLDGVQVQMLWNTHTPTQKQELSSGGVGPELCQLTLPDGQQHLLQVEVGGAYDRYVAVAGQWCQWVKQNLLSTSNNAADLYDRTEPQTDRPIDSRSVLTELQKIRRFNFLLDNSSILNSPSDPSQSFRLNSDLSDLTITNNSVSEALQKTTKAIQDINALLAQKH
ncbi:uncharacterized protein C5orf34 homolog isoform X1 [Colossoma macropomum]|uniref:uncharacterized protein C5orf34 homolog isoform X1 n=1 Tax=Colossoma macropomum TaxID=42526 RepID=UPI001863B4C4|nr:uncharacterized protein C5orf34 homolog isoform X1 [Colossoma macropomum]XP_036453992.1 uncharacterized protein C5orf34 homolog isoform X1 [Colossoma macropomum]XP_036453993.1 uncharacterized protein C5orf34 homolog isoform X1 [Colossoma macropomum]XP_036453994.1 uncharacterized protein C5orf34 homolog isoform X1 [Colossoma macropomum]